MRTLKIGCVTIDKESTTEEIFNNLEILRNKYHLPFIDTNRKETYGFYSKQTLKYQEQDDVFICNIGDIMRYNISGYMKMNGAPLVDTFSDNIQCVIGIDMDFIFSNDIVIETCDKIFDKNTIELSLMTTIEDELNEIYNNDKIVISIGHHGNWSELFIQIFK